jgi:hypothetical protein
MFLLIATVLSSGKKLGQGCAAFAARRSGLNVRRYGARFTGGGVHEPSTIEGGVLRGA